jgi:uncharacterized linocin/CFP29 family protein
MPDDVARIPWTEEQWAAVNRTVQEAACKARIASSFLPLVGPLPPGQSSVPSLSMDEPDLKDRLERGEATKRFEIDDSKTLPLTTLSCEVYLTTQQVEDPALASAKQMLGRAADLIGRLEDAIVFNGQPGSNRAPRWHDEDKGLVVEPEVYRVQGGKKCPGLLYDEDLPGEFVKKMVRSPRGNFASDLVTKIGDAIQTLEGNGHYGPFACVLGHELYRDAITPHTGSLVLASDRIVAFLDGGPLRRSSVVPTGGGVVVSLAGSPIDLVVASDIHVKFLQVTLEPRYVFRVSERLVLRLKQPTARCRLESEVLPGEAGDADDEAQQLAVFLDDLAMRVADIRARHEGGGE